ncbi:MAG: arginine--tRNA ligase, partial [Candidatus Obscuribacterales bacterium]|nr:arginine--tRNA ligase [Candidatus Obscuribacterales bacterium]
IVLAELSKALIQESQKQLLSKLGINFDRWYQESELHKYGKVEAALDLFRKSEFTVESESALWLKTTAIGDERDRVLVKSDGSMTYLAVDAAYHLDKFQRGYALMINVWGADHHGQIPSLKAAVKALGEDPEKLEVILTQIVNLSRDGQLVRMSKRKGTVVYLEDLMNEVGRDSVRYYLAESSPQNSINFDLEQAKKTGRENPSFYIQYAHARCCAILRRALEPVFNSETKLEESPALTQAKWAQWLSEFKAEAASFSALFDESADLFVYQKKLIMQLASFPEEIEEALITRQPGRIARFAYELANDLQKFYELFRVITDDEECTRARLGLIVASRQVLANALGIIGVTAVERM